MKRSIKQSTILLIGVIISLFINSYRLLQLFEIISHEARYIQHQLVPVTAPDLLMRFFTFIVLSWLILEFNLIWIDRFFHHSKRILKITVALVGSVFITHSNHYLFVHSYEFIFGIKIPEWEQEGEVFGWYLVLLALFLIIFIIRLQLKSKNEAIEKEQLKREKEQLKQEKIKSELVAIKNQVNPHFLFNSLNTLNSVIRNNPEKATDFVDKLSFMYRYILQSSEKDLVPLKEELAFLNSYVYLINIRYGTRFVLENNLNLDVDTTEIPVISLQLLVENAVKHNEVSEQNPLKVKIYNDSEYIVVENKIRARSSLEEGTGNGLLSLSKRYKILKNRNIKIYRDSSFMVKLPID